MLDIALLVAWLTGLLPFLLFLIVLIIMDLILGVALALRQKRFQWEKLADFAYDAPLLLLMWFMAEALEFLPLLFVIEVPSYIEAVASGSGLVVFGLVMLKYVGSILGHIATIKEYQGGYGIVPSGHNPWG